MMAGSPASAFAALEADTLRPLPAKVFVLATWSTATVGPDIHAKVGKTIYSVPWRFIGQRVDARSTPLVVQLFCNGQLYLCPTWYARLSCPSRAARETRPRGQLRGLLKDEVRWPRRHYLGDSALSWFGDGDTVLLGCRCGDWGCRPFTAIVTVAEHTMSWSGYRTGHRDWDYRQLREVTFDRIQYEEALRATAR
jgi:hypothetical protein